jgi:signal transduction histidine kinase
MIFLAASLLVSSLAFSAEPKRVMVLHSFGRDFKPWDEYARTIRTELERQSSWPLDIIDQSLVAARSSADNSEQAFSEYLGALYTTFPLDLIVSIGAPAAAFVQRNRASLFANVPMVFTAVDERRVQFTALTPNDAVVPVRIEYLKAIENILRVLPDTEQIVVVVGTSPIEKFWKEEIGREVKPLAERLSFSWTDTLWFEQFLQQAAALPPRTAIFWELMIVDAAGVVHEGSAALGRLHAVANAPIFSYDDTFFGGDIVGGPMLSVAEGSRQAAAVAVRILGGEKAGDIKVPPIRFTAPKFDWREMQRWGISESRLPPGSEIHFRKPTAWEEYRLQIVVVSAALAVQSALILWLVYEHRRRHFAEIQYRNSMAELTRMNRMATAGELSAAIAHEVKQPLAAMVTGAGAALRWLSGAKPNIGEARQVLDNIVKTGHHADDIIANMRAMFRKDTQERATIDINKLIWLVLGLVYMDMRKYSIESRATLGEGLPAISGNEVQLQQVILNLVMNAIESMRSVEQRVLSIKSEFDGNNHVHIAVEDTGSGVDPSNMDHIFKPLFTTKTGGMGMGLSICRSIIENHEGRIWVSSAASRGSIFHVELPTNASQPATERETEVLRSESELRANAAMTDMGQNAKYSDRA